ncbi:methyltransferase domain-containing protein [Pyrobaculum ferrireducens]|uniref:Putative RNA methylase n=1 Tax=Pyrobaculum ferrireducens TaxID=1104324 RepID=G7VD09_9CREN|nr:methyltransferase domain-containing protein [Pyrobaculum ferrireducens]AET33888.1 putative RNA methylase [Pyrobaculum ferrireducens]
MIYVAAVAVAAIVAVLHFLWPYLVGRGGAYSTSSRRAAEWAFRRIGVAGKKVYDLGCGYGGVLALAKAMGAVPVGVEIDPVRWLVCALRCGCRVVLGDMFKTPLRDADVVYIFQWPSVNARLAEKFRRELRSGAYVVSYMWEVPGLRLVAYNPALRVYVYQV